MQFRHSSPYCPRTWCQRSHFCLWLRWLLWKDGPDRWWKWTESVYFSVDDRHKDIRATKNFKKHPNKGTIWSAHKRQSRPNIFPKRIRAIKLHLPPLIPTLLLKIIKLHKLQTHLLNHPMPRLSLIRLLHIRQLLHVRLGHLFRQGWLRSS